MSSFTTPSAPGAPIVPLSRFRLICAVVTVVVALALGVLAGLAAWNPWGYVRLGPSGYWMAGALILVPLTAGVISVLFVRAKGPAIALGVICGVVTLVVACGGGAVALWTDADWDRAVLATSPGGGYQVVSLTDDSITWRYQVRIAHPDGVLTRESPSVLCLEAGFGDPPKNTVVSARFVAEHEIEVTLDDRSTWRTTFDPDTLRPASIRGDYCG